MQRKVAIGFAVRRRAGLLQLRIQPSVQLDLVISKWQVPSSYMFRKCRGSQDGRK